MSKKDCTYNKNLIPDENLPPNKSRDLLQSYFSFLAITLQACNFTLRHAWFIGLSAQKYIEICRFIKFFKYYEGNINKKQSLLIAK